MSVEPITLRGTELSGKAGTEVEAARTGKRGRRLRIFGRYVALSVLAFVVLFPIYITIVNSLLLPSQIASKSPTFFPTSPQWHTYSDAWSDGHLASYLRNSFIQTGLIVAGQLVTSILAGYAFAFLRFPFKRTLFVVSLARPTIAALAVFSFLSAWNQYLWPLLVTRDDQLRTVQIGLKQLRATNIDQVNVTFAGTVLAFIPLVILLLIFQKQLVRGLTAGAVKG